MKKHSIITIFCLCVLCNAWCQTLKWDTICYPSDGECYSVDVVATIYNTLEEPCFVMISQNYEVNQDSLEWSFGRKLWGTRFGDVSLGQLIHDAVEDSSEEKIFIPETFIKKLTPNEVFKIIVSTYSSLKEDVKESLNNRLLIIPASVAEKVDGTYFDEWTEKLGYQYKPNQVSVFWYDLHCRIRWYDDQIISRSPLQAQESFSEDSIVSAYDCEIHPEYPGGESEFFRYITHNYRYPKELIDKGFIGRVTGEFVIEKDGSISSVNILKSPHESLNEEFIRLVKSMPKWSQAKWRGKKVRSRYVLPLNAPRF